MTNSKYKSKHRLLSEIEVLKCFKEFILYLSTPHINSQNRSEKSQLEEEIRQITSQRKN